MLVLSITHRDPVSININILGRKLEKQSVNKALDEKELRLSIKLFQDHTLALASTVAPFLSRILIMSVCWARAAR